MNYSIRPIQDSDTSFLWEMLYQAIYVPDGVAPVSRDILNHPDIAKYLLNWGSKGDIGFVAVDSDNNSIEAVWIRLFNETNKGYDYVDDNTPELSIAVHRDYRGKGVGSILLIEIIRESKRDGYKAISLSVDPSNPATHLYQRHGFEKVGSETKSWIRFL